MSDLAERIKQSDSIDEAIDVKSNSTGFEIPEARLNEQAATMPVTADDIRDMEMISDINQASNQLFTWVEDMIRSFFEGEMSYTEMRSWIQEHSFDIKEVVDVLDSKGYTVKQDWQRIDSLLRDIESLGEGGRWTQALDSLQGVA